MKVPESIKVEWADGAVIELRSNPSTELHHALQALESFRLELYRASGVPLPALVREPRR